MLMDSRGFVVRRANFYFDFRLMSLHNLVGRFIAYFLFLVRRDREDKLQVSSLNKWARHDT